MNNTNNVCWNIHSTQSKSISFNTQLNVFQNNNQTNITQQQRYLNKCHICGNHHSTQKCPQRGGQIIYHTSHTVNNQINFSNNNRNHNLNHPHTMNNIQPHYNININNNRNHNHHPVPNQFNPYQNQYPNTHITANNQFNYHHNGNINQSNHILNNKTIQQQHSNTHTKTNNVNNWNNNNNIQKYPQNINQNIHQIHNNQNQYYQQQHFNLSTNIIQSTSNIQPKPSTFVTPTPVHPPVQINHLNNVNNGNHVNNVNNVIRNPLNVVHKQIPIFKPNMNIIAIQNDLQKARQAQLLQQQQLLLTARLQQQIIVRQQARQRQALKQQQAIQRQILIRQQQRQLLMIQEAKQLQLRIQAQQLQANKLQIGLFNRSPNVVANNNSSDDDDDNKSEISYAPLDDDNISEDEIRNISDYEVNYSHVKVKVTEISDCIQVNENHSGFKLLNVFDKIDITKDDLSLWKASYFSSKKSAKHQLKDVINFAETNNKCSKHIKTKMRVITKLILDKGIKNSSEYKQILLLLASHGSVCNVMKEVAINNAYGLMTDKLDNILKMQSLKQQIIKTLRDYRVLLVEELFHKCKLGNNTHNIAGFHNIIAKQIGIKEYNDPDISTYLVKQYSKNLDKRFFREMYTKENILNHIVKQINEKKISYQKIVKYFQDHCPKDIDDKYSFLEKAIDINTGKINQQYLCWLLRKLKIFIVKKNDWKDIQYDGDYKKNLTSGPPSPLGLISPVLRANRLNLPNIPMLNINNIDFGV